MLHPLRLCLTDVGKSSILERFVTSEFSEYDMTATTGVSFMSKLFKHNGASIKYNVRSPVADLVARPDKLKIWDTAGQEKYHALAPMYYKDAHIAIIVYDITDRETFRVMRK